MVFARRGESGTEYRLNGELYSGKDLQYVLGEIHIDASRSSAIAVILEDDLALRDVKEVPAMALNAGFTDVRVFVYWKKTGRMAEVFLGPVIKYNGDESRL
jgi:hypothetical protein